MQLHCAPIKGHGNGQPALDDRPPGDGGSPETPREARGKGVNDEGEGTGPLLSLGDPETVDAQYKAEFNTLVEDSGTSTTIYTDDWTGAACPGAALSRVASPI